ncbi:hypothetical protein [Terrarubrum flagellatum]|uniref:hypothetical protein n=1 Tax=Terrirubrum flagellatum TaxID=2895980 RepID=UPI0031450F36
MVSAPFSATSYASFSAGLMKDLRNSLTDLQRQLSTGQKSLTYGGLGQDRFASLNYNAKLSTLNGYSNVIQSSSFRLSMMDTALNNFSSTIQSAQTAATAGSYEPDASGRPIAQVSADDQIKMMIDLMNTDISGQYLFSGRSSDTKPVLGYDAIMNGTAGKAGVKQMIAERQAADLGTGGLGRLEAPSISGSTVTLQRDATNTGPFGFTISGVSTTSANIATSGPAGAQQTTTINFTGQPNDADTVTVTLTLPDGSTQDVTLKAAQSTPVPTNGFLIGATPAATAANFQTALQTAVQKQAETSLKASSSIVASQAFFAGSNSSPPQRVPSPAASATGLVAGTSANTVIWYQGDDDTTSFPNARSTATAKVGDALTVNTGARANEAAFQQSFAMLAALSLTDVAPSDPNGQERYAALTQRVGNGLSFPNNMQSVKSVQMELANSNSSINTAKDRLTATKNVIQASLDKIQNTDDQEVTASILALQTRLEATYSTTATLSGLSLTKFLS